MNDIYLQTNSIKTYLTENFLSFLLLIIIIFFLLLLVIIKKLRKNMNNTYYILFICSEHNYIKTRGLRSFHFAKKK